MDAASIARGIKTGVDSNGFGFQRAVEQGLRELIQEKGLGWVVIAAEFPVQVGSSETHIDIILTSHTRGVYVIVECKRVNPAFGAWSFVQSNVLHEHYPKAVFEQLQFVGQEGRDFRRNIRMDLLPSRGFDVGMHLKADAPGDPKPTSNKDLQDAVTQVLRGASGLANHVAEEIQKGHRHFVMPATTLTIIPAIVTTAALWTSETDISKSDLHSGAIDPTLIDPEEAASVWYFYNRSRSLRNEVVSSRDSGYLHDWLLGESTRSVAIVNSGHLERFFELVDAFYC